MDKLTNLQAIRLTDDKMKIRTFVANRDMSRICAMSIFSLRFDSDKCDLTQTLLRYLVKKTLTGASA